MKKRFNHHGFTLAEMVIVIGIIGVLTAIFSGAYRNQQTHVKYNIAVSKVLQLIQTARNYAVTSRGAMDNGVLRIPPAGYGVYIERTPTPRVILFSNLSDAGNRAQQYDRDATAPNDGIEETYNLPADITFEALTGYAGQTSTLTQRMVIIFTPPLADAFVAQNAAPGSATFNAPVPYDELRLRLSRPDTPGNTTGLDGSDQSIHFDKTAGFAEIEL